MPEKKISSAGPIVLLFVTLGVLTPFAIEAMFPGSGQTSFPSDKQLQGEEQPISQVNGSSDEIIRMNSGRDNQWRNGEVLLASSQVFEDNIPQEAGVENNQEKVEELKQNESPFDIRPGVYAGFSRSWNNFNDTVRQKFTLGGFFFPSDKFRIDGSGSELHFSDNSDHIDGRGGLLALAQRFSKVVLEEGLGAYHYDGLHDSWNGFFRGFWAATERLSFGLEVEQMDYWERLINIRNKLSLFYVAPNVTYDLTPSVWLSGSGSIGQFSDSNDRTSVEGEAGYKFKFNREISISAGTEYYDFSKPSPDYWSPSSFAYYFGRLRWLHNFYSGPFQERIKEYKSWKERWRFLAETTAGVTQKSELEISAQGGLAYQATDRLGLSLDAYHLFSNGRFDESYRESQVGGKVTWCFGQ